jgi:hypothetical protein
MGEVSVKQWVLMGGAAVVLCAGLGFGLLHYLRTASGRDDGEPDPVAGAGEPASKYPLAAPPLRLRVVKWDFGTISPGTELNHRFKIANTSAEPWILKHVTSTCTCTVGKLPSKTVKPGETTWLKITYLTPHRDGKVSGYVMVEFAEPAGPVLQLMIEGEVRGQRSAEPPNPVRSKGPLEAVPEHLAFGTVESGKTALKKVLLRTAPDLGELTEKDLILTHNLGDELDVQVRKEKSAHQYVLVVRFQPKRPRDKVEGEIEIKIGKGNVPAVRVKVSGAAK